MSQTAVGWMVPAFCLIFFVWRERGRKKEGVEDTEEQNKVMNNNN